MAVSGGDMTCCCEEVVLYEASCCDVMFIGCVVLWAAAVMLVGCVVAVSADVFGSAVDVAAVILAAVTI